MPELDALVILTSGSHGPAVEAGVDAGLPVFAEKPLAFTLAEADAIEGRLAADPGRRLQVGYMKLYDPAVLHARALAEERGYGCGAVSQPDGSVCFRVWAPVPRRSSWC